MFPVGSGPLMSRMGMVSKAPTFFAPRISRGQGPGPRRKSSRRLLDRTAVGRRQDRWGVEGLGCWLDQAVVVHQRAFPTREEAAAAGHLQVEDRLDHVGLDRRDPGQAA